MLCICTHLTQCVEQTKMVGISYSDILPPFLIKQLTDIL